MCREVGVSRSPLDQVDGDWYFCRSQWRLEQFSAADTRGQSCAFFPLFIPVLRGAVGAMVVRVIRVVVTMPPVVQGSILPMLHSERRRSCGWLQAFLNTCKDHPQDTSIRLSVQ